MKNNSRYQDGNLLVNGHVYRRPCDWAVECGPSQFLGGPRAWTPSALFALATTTPTPSPFTFPHSTHHPSISNLQSQISPLQSSISNLQSSISNLQSSISNLHPLRGLPDDFLVFAVDLDTDSPSVCGLTTAATTLTVRFEDVWLLLQPDRRAFSYMCEVTRDPHSKDAPSAKANGVVRESIPHLAPDARICLDLADNGGFVLSFNPEFGTTK